MRKSSEEKERQAQSIPAQKDEVRKKFGHLNILEFIEEERSAFTENNRPEFARLMKLLDAGEVQGLLAWHPDRLSRNEVDAAMVTTRIRKGVIKDIQFVSYNYDPSPEGMFMLQFTMAQSQHSSARLSINVKRGLMKKARDGWMPGEAPLGYKNTPWKAGGTRTILKDEKSYPLIRQAFDLMLTGCYSVPQILEIVNNQWGFKSSKRGKTGLKGNHQLSRSSLYKIFTNCFYAGIYEYPVGSGEWHEGQHPRMVSMEEFERVQVLLGRGGKPSPVKRYFAYTGAIECPCGGQVTAEIKMRCRCTACGTKFSCLHNRFCAVCKTGIEEMNQPNIYTFTYYRCSRNMKGVKCTEKALEVTKMEEQLKGYLGNISIKKKYLDLAINQLRKKHALESEKREFIQDAQTKAYEEASRNLDNLLSMRMNGEITADEYLERKSKEKQSQVHFKLLLNQTDQKQDDWLKSAEDAFNFAARSLFWFMEADTENNLKEKKKILTTLGSKLVLTDKKLLIIPKREYGIIENMLAHVPDAKPEFETHGVPVKESFESKTEISETDRLSWFPGRDSNPDTEDQNLMSCL